MILEGAVEEAVRHTGIDNELVVLAVKSYGNEQQSLIGGK
jgi:hypothetical protein